MLAFSRIIIDLIFVAMSLIVFVLAVEICFFAVDSVRTEKEVVGPRIASKVMEESTTLVTSISTPQRSASELRQTRLRKEFIAQTRGDVITRRWVAAKKSSLRKE